MAIAWMWDDPVVARSGVPEPDEATLTPFGEFSSSLSLHIWLAQPTVSRDANTLPPPKI
jgi:hypothetical protein